MGSRVPVKEELQDSEECPGDYLELRLSFGLLIYLEWLEMGEGHAEVIAEFTMRGQGRGRGSDF